MEEHLRDFEKLKKDVWSLKGTLNVDEIKNKIAEFQKEVESSVEKHIAISNETLTSFQEDVENNIQTDLLNPIIPSTS